MTHGQIQHPRMKKKMTITSTVHFIVEIVEFEAEVELYDDGSFAFEPKREFMIPVIEKAKEQVAMGNCQAEFRSINVTEKVQAA